MNKRNVKFDDDDGRTIADMSDLPDVSAFRSFRGKKHGGENAVRQSQQRESEGQSDRPWEDHSMSRQERRAYVASAIGATLMIGLVYLICFGTLIWLITRFAF